MEKNNFYSIYRNFVIIVSVSLLFLVSVNLFFVNINETSLIGFISKIWFWGLILFACVYFLFLFEKHKQIRISKIDLFTFFLIFLFALLTYFFHHEPLMGDHDVGDYAIRAIEFVKTGFFYSHAFPVYNLLLSVPYFISAKFTYLLVNPFLLFLSLSLIYFIAFEVTGKKKLGLIAVILIWSTYPSLWFFRRSLSENLWFFLFFLSLFFIANFLRSKDFSFILLSLLVGLIALITRIEAFLFFTFIVAIFIYYLTTRFRKKLPIRLDFFKKSRIYILFPIFFLLALINFLIVFFGERFYKIGYFLGPFLKVLNDLKRRNPSVVNIVNYNTKNPTYKTYLLRYIIDTFSAYHLFFYLFFSVFLFLYLLIKNRRKIANLFNSSISIFLFIELAYFLSFVVEPSTGFTQPWFLRHFWVPVSSLSIVVFCLSLSYKNLIRLRSIKLLIFLLIFINLFSNIDILFFSEYKGSYNFLQSLASRTQTQKESNYYLNGIFPDNKNNLIIVDKAMFSNYGKSLACMTGSYPISEKDRRLYEKNIMSEYRNVYLLYHYDIFKNRKAFTKNDISIKFIKKSCLKTKRLKYIRKAHDYAKNWLIPPIHLNQGYGPFAYTVSLLPPKTIHNYSLCLYLYKLEK